MLPSVDVRAQSLSHARLCETPCAVAHQAPLPMELSRQEYCSGLPFPMPRDIPDLGIKLVSFVLPALIGEFFTTVPSGKPSAPIQFLLIDIPNACLVIIIQVHTTQYSVLFHIYIISICFYCFKNLHNHRLVAELYFIILEQHNVLIHSPKIRYLGCYQFC